MAKREENWDCWIYQWIYVGLQRFLEELGISPDLAFIQMLQYLPVQIEKFLKLALSSQGNSSTTSWILFSLMWLQKTFKIILWSKQLVDYSDPIS